MLSDLGDSSLSQFVGKLQKCHMVNNVYRFMSNSTANHEPISAYRVAISVASSARIEIPRNPTQTSAYPDYLHIVYTCHTTISLLFFESMAEEDFAKFYLVFPLYN